MSGTSMDGIDLALIESDGEKVITRKNFAYLAYSKDFKTRLSGLIYNTPSLEEIKVVENELTILHAKLVNDFLLQNNLNAKEIDVIAFHGHTILHMPEQGITWQIGNAHLLSHLCGIDVIFDFRARDIALGGQGAPLVPIYHFHLFANQKKPTAALNIGGISNITYFASDNESEIEAFDICFGNAPIDDLMKKKLGRDFDHNGEIAKKGTIDLLLADRILQNEIFHKKPPKSFDRDDFSEIIAPINNLKIEDALATFAYMHAKAIDINLNFLKQKPHEIFVCGGGRKNLSLMDEMKKQISGTLIRSVEEIGLNGDAVEAEAFAFLAIRSLVGLPISFKNTTGVCAKTPNHKAACGGVLFKADIIC
jgi:anhydro-N-acetylmuramic acid kinase